MPEPIAQILRRHSRPLEPIPTEAEPVLGRVDGIRAVLFDLYGTLVISGSGEVGVAASQRAAGLAPAPQRALDESLSAVEIHECNSPAQGVECYFQAIAASHERSRRNGIDYPEVDIVEIWRKVLAEMARRGLIDASAAAAADVRRLAAEYEARTNPCWPMPHLRECLAGLRDRGLALGIVSNAQFYSPELFPALLGKPAEKLGFSADLQYYSYKYGRAKPGTTLFEMAAESLSRRAIAPGETLYLGNDLLNDVLPASQVGFRTALFAGDARSLRLRHGDARTDGISPDRVLTTLGQFSDL
ncbi:MAG: HAD family hydrolase [Candidatus Nealsonbacteria bacterium]|nr:HAD family hydrolase [Candidatus Nealsonbacteria bacterium]